MQIRKEQQVEREKLIQKNQAMETMQHLRKKPRKKDK